MCVTDNTNFEVLQQLHIYSLQFVVNIEVWKSQIYCFYYTTFTWQPVTNYIAD